MIEIKIEVHSKYPDEIKLYVKEYNTGVDQKDINIVGTAINSLVAMAFSPDEINRAAAIHALDQIGRIQPGFLKSAVKTFIIRYKGIDEEKSRYAAEALQKIFIGKKAERLITDPNVLKELKLRKQQEEEAKKKEELKRKELVKQIQSTSIDLSLVNAFPEIKAIGQYYNNSLLNNDMQKAKDTLLKLLHSLIEWQQSDRAKFTPGCLLFGLLLSKPNRKPFAGEIVKELLQQYYKGNKVVRNAAAEIIESVFDEIEDLIPEDLATGIRSEIIKKKEEKEKLRKKEMEKALAIKKLKVPISIGWVQSIQKIAQDYNQGIVDNKEKLLKQARSALEKALGSQDIRERKHAIELLGILLGKNPDYVKPLFFNLLSRYSDPQYSEILGNFIEDLAKLQWAEDVILEQLRIDKKKREEEEEKRRKQRQAEYEKIKEITIKIDGDWSKPVVKMAEALNNALLNNNMKQAQKLINNELKKFLFAKEQDIRKEGQVLFARIAKKYPQLLKKIMEELEPLYLSDHEHRNLAVDAFGTIYDMGFAEQFFAKDYPDVWKILPEDWANRKQELENLELQQKFDAIKADVTQIRIRDSWHKSIQKIVRDYNHGIKAKQMEQVFASVKKIVDMVMNEKKEELQEQANQVLGLIAKRNIELIQPTIDLFMKLVDGADKDKKTRAIKGLGEVTRQRPGWAYFGIEKLLDIAKTDPDPEFRMKAMLEVGRIAEKDPVMLIEHIDQIIDRLANDSNKHVRRLAAWTLGNMAETIPLEAKEAIPALTDALHDEYVLVRKFADKALSAIREAIRKQEQG